MVNGASCQGNNIRVYPTSTRDEVNVSGAAQTKAVLYNSIGQLVQATAINGNEAKISLNLLPAGIYNLVIIGEGINQTYRITKQ